MDAPSVRIQVDEVFERQGVGSDTFIEYRPEPGRLSYFVGRNGSGKSKAARIIATRLQGKYLSTDRLMGIMSVDNYGWGSIPSRYKGTPLDENRDYIIQQSGQSGTATGILLTLREDPVVGLKVAAFIKRALGRTLIFRESAGFFDPYVALNGIEYSLLRDEGHGLRELTVLLAAIYTPDWTTLVVDEPELHLHPALAQLVVSELNRECVERAVHAVVVTHEPTMVRPATAENLEHVWLFQPGKVPQCFASAIYPGSERRLTASMQKNPQLLSQLAFAPRPVLVEGIHDVAALSVTLARTQSAAVVAQTELVPCGSSNQVAVWFELAKKLGLDVKAVADLDALFSGDLGRTLDRNPDFVRQFREDFLSDRAHEVIRPLIQAADAAGIEKTESARARWLAEALEDETKDAMRRDRLLAMLKREGLWLHPQGTLEDVLGNEKGGVPHADAAASPGAIDPVAAWCAYELDAMGDLVHLLRETVERIANSITQAIGADPNAVLTGPVGPMSTSDAKLVDVTHVGNGRYRLTVKAPPEFAGYYAEVDRQTPPAGIVLVPVPE